MITFLQSDAKTELIRRDPTLGDLDAAKWAAKVTVALKIGLALYQANLNQTLDPWIIKSTLDAPLSSGTAKIGTTLADVYEIAYPADCMGVANNTIWVDTAGTAVFLAVPRLSIDSIVPAAGATQTLYGFHETKGFVVLEVKDPTFTAPAVVHFEYLRSLVPTAVDTDTLDIKPQDFSSFIDSVASLIATV